MKVDKAKKKRPAIPRRGSFRSLRETAEALGISHAQVVILERQAIGKLLIGLGLFTYNELPWRIRKYLPRKALRRPSQT